MKKIVIFSISTALITSGLMSNPLISHANNNENVSQEQPEVYVTQNNDEFKSTGPKEVSSTISFHDQSSLEKKSDLGSPEVIVTSEDDEYAPGGAAESIAKQGIKSTTTFFNNSLSSSNNGGISTNVVVSDGARFTWDYVDTSYSTSLFESKVSPWISRILLGGLSAVVLKRVPGDFKKGAVGTITGAAVASMKTTDTRYFKVYKYVDTDAYNVYIKYSVYQYSDKARTKLTNHYIQVHRT